MLVGGALSLKVQWSQKHCLSSGPGFHGAPMPPALAVASSPMFSAFDRVGRLSGAIALTALSFKLIRFVQRSEGPGDPDFPGATGVAVGSSGAVEVEAGSFQRRRLL